ncbi:NifB/NifX family molybdenum-iron cluster-binding protein [Desulfogranum marinum]|uniref:NifB/NifX family molybdenum-iron cluster-binding protein n=2 Tax=Desulfogranum marinum TaxID=453220 RepID=UPI0029C87A91|nr:NifB/NifX family molybdenum-iron cluster-binding protein [Desulfogranum marinum]
MNMQSIQTILLSIVVVLFVAISPGVTAQTMKIAVPATGAEKNSLISEETGRAPYYLLFDEKGHFIEAMKNPAKDQAGGISRTVASLLSANNVTIIIAQAIGDKMKQALTAHNIKFVNNGGAADDSVKTFLQGQ